MSFEVGAIRSEIPDASTVARYLIDRLPENPQFGVDYVETKFTFETPVVVDSATDANADTKHETITVEAWQGRTDLVGKMLIRAADHTDIVRVVDFDAETGEVTLSLALKEDLTGVEVTLKRRNQFGALILRHANEGRRWSLTLGSEQPDDFARMRQMLGEVFFVAVKEWLTEVGETGYTDNDIEAVINSLALKQRHIDAFITEALERVEMDRRAGTFSPATVTGNAPPVE